MDNVLKAWTNYIFTESSELTSKEFESILRLSGKLQTIVTGEIRKKEETVFSFCSGQTWTCREYSDTQNSGDIVQLLFSLKIIYWELKERRESK